MDDVRRGILDDTKQIQGMSGGLEKGSGVGILSCQGCVWSR